MSPEAWAAVIASITTVGTIAVGYFKTKQTAEEVVDRVEEVRRLTAPIGNGFVDDIKRTLQEIADSQARTESVLIQHLTDHARASINGRN